MRSVVGVEHAATSVAFVGSLLPARFLVESGTSLSVRKIVVLTEAHERSYSYVARRLSDVVVSRLSRRQPRTLRLAAELMTAKLRCQRVLFFHECCWPQFDILVSLIRPRALFFPQVTMTGFEVVDPVDLPQASDLKSKIKRAVTRLLRPLFVIYRAPRDSGLPGHDFLFSFRKYPLSVRVFPVGYRMDDRIAMELPPHEDSGPPKVILIGGSEPVPNDYLRTIYVRLIEMARSEGYHVCLKDHPIHRLDVPAGACEIVDPALPIELVESRFAFSIGVASTALFAVGDRKISILSALDAMPDDVKGFRRKRLLSQATTTRDQIEFVSDLDEVRRLLRTRMQAGHSGRQ
jgi:hypothetical protein